MKKVLFISYYFPPTGGGGVQRVLKFVKYLPLFDRIPIVVTTEELKNYTVDKSLIKDIPDKIKIFRLPAYALNNIKIKNILIRKFFSLINQILIPDESVLWYLFNKNKILNIITENNIDTILTSSKPHSVHLFGLFLKRRIDNIKWIADFRDEFTTNPEIKTNKIIRYNLIKRIINKNIESGILNNADKILVVTPAVKNKYLNLYNNKNIELLTNGYDEEDFKNIKIKYNNKKFKVLCYGSLYGPNQPFTFLKAVKNIIKENNIKDMQVDFRGRFDKIKKIRQYILEHDLSDYVKINEYIDHRDLLKTATEYNLLLLILSNSFNDIYPAKVFEYFRLNKPILAVTPDNSAVSKLLYQTGTGINADYKSVEKISKVLKKLYDKFKNNTLQKEYETNKKIKIISSFERKNITNKLNEIMDSI